MKILFLHLSDMHFINKNAYEEENINGIVNSLNQDIKEISEIFIIISGDLVQSGSNAEYKQVDKFLNALKSLIISRYRQKSIQILIVPGNHDINYNIGKGDIKVEGLRVIQKNKEYEKHLKDEKKKLNPFYKFSHKYGCFVNKKELVDAKIFIFEGKRININLINTAVFSSLEEDQGYHYISNTDINLITKNKDCDFVINIMHHPHYWFCEESKNELQKILLKQSDLLFLGHEHNIDLLKVETSNAKVHIFSGGMLSEKEVWEKSQYDIGILDTNTRKYFTKEFIWESSKKVYFSKNIKEENIKKNRVNLLMISPQDNYMKNFVKDKKYLISSNFNDYYVFPLLEEQNKEDGKIITEINDIGSFLNEIENKKKICISAKRDFGKTFFAKNLFCILSQMKIVIFIDGENIGKDDPEVYIKNAFEAIYTTEQALYEKFKQIPEEEKILIIDNASEVADDYMKKFLEYAEKNFNIVIQMLQEEIELDIRERFKKRNLENEYYFYKICPFYADKRKELVTKLVKILISSDEEEQSKIETLLCDTLTRRRGLFYWNPDFIVQFTKFYCNNIGKSIQNDGDIYNKVFESNLTELIKPCLKKMSVDKAFVILDKIAYEVHINKEDPFKLSRINDIIEKYNKEYGEQVSTLDFVDMLIEAGIFLKVKCDYRFAQRNYLSYFVAREIRRKCIEEGDFSEFQKSLEYACFGINADIVLFVTYITDNVILINKIMTLIEKYTEKWEEFSINPFKIRFLEDTSKMQLAPVSKIDKKEDIKNEVRQERKNEELQEKFDNDYIYNYDDSEIKLMDELIRSISLMSILSRVLPNFEHIMPINNKKKCVELIYSLPLKIFNIWALSLEEIKAEVVNELKNIDNYTYRKEPFFKTDEDVLEFLKWESMSLLLDLMNTSIGNASKENTYGYLDGHQYQDNQLYRIEHLMELTKKDSEQAFSKEIIEMYPEIKHSFIKTMVQRVTRNYIITSKRIKEPTIQRLNSKIFNNRLNQSTILLQKANSSKKE